MDDEVKLFLTKKRDIVKKLKKYTIDNLFIDGLNKEVNIIIIRLIEYDLIDKDILIDNVIKNIKRADDIITLGLCLRNGCNITDELLEYMDANFDTDLLTKIKILIEIHNKKVLYTSDNINMEYIFLCNIILNINTMLTDLNYDDYYNIIGTMSSLYKIKMKDGELLKQSYRSYNYRRFVEMVENNIFPDYVMINDIIISISINKGVPRLELINMLCYLIHKNIKLDKWQVDILLNKKDHKLNYENKLLFNEPGRDIQQYHNNEDIIFSIIEVIEEKIVISNKINEDIMKEKFIVIDDNVVTMMIDKSRDIIFSLTGRNLDKIKYPLYYYKDNIKLTQEHSLMTLCRMVMNHYKNRENKSIIKLINDIK